MPSKQHKKPCADCPWRQNAIRSWLGVDEHRKPHPPEFFLRMADGEVIYDCHLHSDHQCAGLAIFRANILKTPRYKEILRLPPDRMAVFADREAFQKHHTLKPIKKTN